MKLGTVSGSHNPADLVTKQLPVARLRPLMCVLGMSDLKCGSLEGADDPGGLFKKRQDVIPLFERLEPSPSTGMPERRRAQQNLKYSFQHDLRLW